MISDNENLNIDIANNDPINISFVDDNNLDIDLGETPCIRNYPGLANKPTINGHVVVGDLLDSDLDLEHKLNVVTEQQIDRIIWG